MNIKDALLIIISLINLFFAIILLTGKREAHKIDFSGIVFFISVWAFCLAFFRLIPSDSAAIVWMRFSYIGSVWIAASFLLFSLELFGLKLSLLKRLFILSPTIILSIIVVIPGVFLTEVIHHSYGREALQNPFNYFLFSIYFFVYYFWALFALIKKYRASHGSTKNQLFFVLISVTIAGLFGMYFDLVLSSPLLRNWEFVWLGPLFTFFLSFFVGMAVSIYRSIDLFSVTKKYIVFITSLFICTIAAVILHLLVFVFFHEFNEIISNSCITFFSILLFSSLQWKLNKFFTKKFIFSVGR